MYADLDWLEAEYDFRPQLKALRAEIAAGGAVEERLHGLARFRLDLNQLGLLGGAAAAYLAGDPAPGPLAESVSA